MTKYALAMVAALALAGCGPNKKVNRDTSTQSQDLSGNWNDVDADLVAKEMIGDCLKNPWASKHAQKAGKNPVVKLYPIKNKSSEQINDQYFTKQVERALLNSGNIDVVAGKGETGDLHDEQKYQSKHASDETAKSAGNEEGADFILNGWIITQNDAADGKEIRAYVTTMELIHAQTGKKVWMGEKKIRKEVAQASASF